MASFLTPEWIAEQNSALLRLSTDSTQTWRVVFEWPDGSSSLPHAITMSADKGAVSLSVGDHIAADALITLSVSDAEALYSGTLDTAVALREGRCKVRGDVSAVVDMANALRAANANT